MKKEKFSLSLFIATWFKTGLIPPIIGKGMAGTYGSFFAIPLCWLGIALTEGFGREIYLYLCIFIYILGILTVSSAERTLGPKKDWKGKMKERDQNQIVIDEVLGMLITCAPIIYLQSYSWYHFLIAFLLFRLFDIVKVFPTKYFDRKKSAHGVMLDDVVAGVYASILLTIFIVKFKIF